MDIDGAVAGQWKGKGRAMPPTSYRPIIDVVLTDTPGSLAFARADYTRVAQRLGALLERVNEAGADATAEELAPLETLAWELARSLSFAIGRISGVENARAFVLSSVDQGHPSDDRHPEEPDGEPMPDAA
jgi:hypothetical protein